MPTVFDEIKKKKRKIIMTNLKEDFDKSVKDVNEGKMFGVKVNKSGKVDPKNIG